MVELNEVTEQNWLQVVRLSVSDAQRSFVAPAVGILARAYVYRNCRARALAVEAAGKPVGLLLVRDLDEEPACYELQQFFIDAAYQGQGYGKAALGEVLRMLSEERKYPCVEVCVNRADLPALHVYEAADFQNTGYMDPELPGYRNLRYMF